VGNVQIEGGMGSEGENKKGTPTFVRVPFYVFRTPLKTEYISAMRI
jgi:hypothetical protein